MGEKETEFIEQKKQNVFIKKQLICDSSRATIEGREGEKNEKEREKLRRAREIIEGEGER